MLETAIGKINGNDCSALSVRLASYRGWPHLGRLSALAFAQAGFQCVGPGDDVACFCCRLTLSKWTQRMNPLAVHCQLSAGQCDFINRRSPPSPRDDVLVSAASSALTAYAITPTTTSASFDQLLDALLSGASPSSGSSPPVADENASRRTLQRVATYIGGGGVWPSTNSVTPSELARAGFYYAGPGDRVQCAFCQGLLRNWEPGDRAMALHAQHFTYCRFVQGHDVGNVPIPFWPLILEPQPAANGAPDTAAEDQIGVSFATPWHTDMAVEARRLATFMAWPTAHHLLPEALAKAGFFFAGEQDASTCFHCGGTVVNWPTGSDPWAEHARRFPTCPFVAQVKGRQFIQEQQQQVGTGDTLEDRDARPATRFAVDPREIRARMDLPLVRVLLRMDYPLDLVREVIQNRLSTVGRDHETSEELLADVFAMHDEKQRARTGADPPSATAAAAMPLVLSFPSSSDGAAHAGTGGSGQRHDDALAIAAASAIDVALAAALAVRESEQQPQSLLPSAAAGSERSTRQQSSGLSPDEENRQLKTQLMCKICMDSLVGIVFLPCGHFVCCAACSPALSTCPICRVAIRGTVRTLL